ncbi:MAG TPA: hypothetical protein VH208_06030, partial [Myxococcaceae bacterium]|nr:hypothetical protein [Myxococcaceae bacterium]
PMTTSDRRTQRRASPLFQSRRKYPRLPLDVDWLIEADGSSLWGRGLELSLRSARLSTSRPVADQVTLYASLPGRARMFQAQGRVTQRKGGVVNQFRQVADADLRLLAVTLLDVGGLPVIPQLDQKFRRFTRLERRFFNG